MRTRLVRFIGAITLVGSLALSGCGTLAGNSVFSNGGSGGNNGNPPNVPNPPPFGAIIPAYNPFYQLIDNGTFSVPAGTFYSGFNGTTAVDSQSATNSTSDPAQPNVTTSTPPPEPSGASDKGSHSIAASIANEFSEATSNMHISALIELGFVLFCITILVNAVAYLMLLAMARRNPAA